MEETQKSWFDRNWKWFIPLLLFVVFVVFTIFIGLMTLGVFQVMKSSDIYQMALHEVQTHEDANRVLGEPIEPGWFLSGNINMSDDDGEAQLSIPVHGTKQAGTVQLEAVKKDGKWMFNSLLLDVDNTDTDIVIY